MTYFNDNVGIGGNITVGANTGEWPRSGMGNFLIPTGASDVTALYLISRGTGSGDLPALKWRNIADVDKLEIWTDMAGGYSRIKSVGYLALHAGHVGYSGTNEFLTITPVGRIGMYCNNPQGPLQIGDANRPGSDAYIMLGTAGVSGGQRTWAVGTSIAAFGNWGFNIHDANSPYPQAALTVQYDITSTGTCNVGIGTDAPQAPLHVGDYRDALSPAAPAREGWLRLSTTNRIGGNRSWDIITTHTRNYHLYIRDANAAADRLMIRYDNGNVGIGALSTLPQGKLDIQADSQTSGGQEVLNLISGGSTPATCPR